MEKLNRFWVGFLVGVVLCALFLYEHIQKYEFHTGSDGQVMWQCNRRTGETKILTSYTSSFEMWHGIGNDFIFNKQTGQIYRYYKNDTNSVPDEGFCPLDYGNPTRR